MHYFYNVKNPIKLGEGREGAESVEVGTRGRRKGNKDRDLGSLIKVEGSALYVYEF